MNILVFVWFFVILLEMDGDRRDTVEASVSMA